jgi:hypothetical protein
MLGLIITVLTIAFGLILSEVQVKLGWGLLLLSLFSVLLIFALVIWLVQKPLQQLLIILVRELKSQFEQKAIVWLLDTDQLMNYELNTDAPEIWLLTSDLLDDAQGGPFQDIVAKNLKKGKNYVYFVPNVPEIKTRIEAVFAHHSNHHKLRVVYLPDNFFFLVPKLDIAIYNPLSKGRSEKSAFMGIPAPGEKGHYHASVTIDFIDKLVGTLLEEYKRQIKNQ